MAEAGMATSTAEATASTPPTSRPLRVALLGSGIFASSAHAPLLRSNDEYECVAVWSRRLERASCLAATFPGSRCRPHGGPEGLDELLDGRRGEIDAAIVALPLDVQPQYVLRCLEAGVPVLSEKPIAPTVKIARELVEAYASKHRPRNVHWSVGENYRYEPAFLAAAEALRRGGVGRPLLFSVVSHLPFAVGNKYLDTEWRASPTFYGGLFVDAFVHSVAALRLLMGSAGLGLRARSASAVLTDTAEHIPGPDTMAALVTFGTNQGACNVNVTNDDEADDDYDSKDVRVQGVVSATFAGSDRRYEITVTGSDGRLELRRTWDAPFGYEVLVYTNGDDEPSRTHYPFGGIEAEVDAFTEACRCTRSSNEGAVALDRNTPEEALADVILLEALLDSGKDGAG